MVTAHFLILTAVSFCLQATTWFVTSQGGGMKNFMALKQNSALALVLSLTFRHLVVPLNHFSQIVT